MKIIKAIAIVASFATLVGSTHAQHDENLRGAPRKEDSGTLKSPQQSNDVKV